MVTIIRKQRLPTKGRAEMEGKLCEPQDGQHQPNYNLTPGAPRNHSEFEGDGARNARAYIANKHTHTQTLQLYIQDNIYNAMTVICK